MTSSTQKVWKNSVILRNSSGRFLHGLPLKLQTERRKQVRARVAACRERKKQQNSNNDATPESPAFKSTQALGRAVSRASRALGPALPHTPKRKRTVVQRLSQRLSAMWYLTG
jgi:hypothetical protein